MRFGTFFMMKKESRITWNLVATLATKMEFLVAKEKMLVALATVSVAISSPAKEEIQKSKDFLNRGLS